MQKIHWIFVIILLVAIGPLSLTAQLMNTIHYRDTTLPRIEKDPAHYNFIYPVPSDVFGLGASYTPPQDGKYMSTNYGPRYILNQDNHQGMDIIGAQVIGGVNYSNPPVLCMCDGEVGWVKNEDTSPSGKTLRIRCDSSSMVFGTPIHIYYRHLDTLSDAMLMADTMPSYSVRVQQGDTLGLVGRTGANWTHLHLDYGGVTPWSSNRKYLNTNRLIDPFAFPHVMGILDSAKVELLHDWGDSTLFRVYWPHNEHINRFEFTNGNYSVVYDMEEVRASYAVYEPVINCRDSMRIFPYRFNGSRTALDYWQNYSLPAIFPASVDRDTNLAMYGYTHYPISTNSVMNILDFEILHLDPNHNIYDWTVKLTDVWGYTIEASLNVLSKQTIQKESTTIKVYPNPAKDNIQVDLGQHYLQNAKIQIFDVEGTLIIQQTITNRETIDISQLSSGVYFLVAGQEQVKFVKY